MEEGGAGGGALPYKKDGGACLTFLELKKQFCYLLGCFCLNRFTVFCGIV